MGVFDFLKGKAVHDSSPNSSNIGVEPTKQTIVLYADSSTVSPDEQKYYRPDDYYAIVTHKGTPFEKKVITFEERKKTTFASQNGLFVAEILLLEYCSYGKYPKPSSGYPGFWWFEYGIRDVGHALESLEKRGFLEWCSMEQGLSSLKLDELKQLLEREGLPTSGKKTDLIKRIIATVPNVSAKLPETCKKYSLTPAGKNELMLNGYVPYMHKHPHKTTENSQFGREFNVWSINRLLSSRGTSNWRKTVGKIEEEMFGVNLAEAEPLKALGDAISGSKMRAYLAEQKNFIAMNIQTKGDGYAEEARGLDLKRIGKDKEALVQFYIAIGKKFDAPALYRETLAILEKYEMYDEILYVIDKGLQYVPKDNHHREELIKRREFARQKIKR